MNWLFSISYYSPYVSGLTIYVKRLAEELVKKGNQVTVLCMQHEQTLSESEVVNGVQVNRAKVIKRISKGFISIDWAIKSWRSVKTSDVVVINLPQAEGWVTAAIAKVMKKKVIAIYHCEIDLPNKIIQRLIEQANWLALELADKIVTYTQDYADNSKYLNRYPGKVDWIYPLIPALAGDKTLEKSLREKIGKGIIIGVAARLAQEKGLEYLLDALEKVTGQVKLAIAGPMKPVGEEKYKNLILDMVEKRKNQVVFLGAIEPEKMGSFYETIDLLVLPSTNSTESFGMVQVEAMFKGVPVVASDLPGVRIPITKTGMGIIVPPKNSQALAEAINEIIKRRDKYIKKRSDLENEFNINETMDFYERLVK